MFCKWLPISTQKVYRAKLVWFLRPILLIKYIALIKKRKIKLIIEGVCENSKN